MKSVFALFALAILALANSSARGGESGQWQVVKVADRDYLTLDNIAQFYQLRGNARLVDRRVALTDGHTRLEMSPNPREIYINGIKEWLCFPAIVKDDQILVSRFDLAKTIEPALRPTMIANLRPFRTVVLDAGHGGDDRGAASHLGAEKFYTLDVIHDVKRSLETKGFKVILTRDGDNYLTLEKRAEIANEIPDAIFVSLHFNSATDGGHANGFEVYAMTPQGSASTGDGIAAIDQFEAAPGNDFDNASLALAACVQSSLLGHITQEDRGVRRARFAVLRLTRAPAILIEGGFLTNSQDSQKINDPAWRERLAESVAEGVASFQDVAGNRRAPKLLADYRNERLPFLGTLVDPAASAVANRPRVTDLVPVSNVPAAIPRVEATPAVGGFSSVN